MSDKYTPQDLQDNLDYLSETKALIKQAIIDKEQAIADDDTFRSYADKIRAIETGIKTDDATATANDLLYPKTAYVGDQKITGQITASYDVASSTLNAPYNITNSSGYNIVDISLQYGFCLLTSAIPTTEYIIGKIATGNKIEVTDKKIKVTDLGLSSSAKMVDSSIGKLLNADSTLTIGMSVENSGNFVYFVNIDPNTFEVKKYVYNSTSFLGIQSDLNCKFVVEINPKDSTVLLLSAYYDYGFKTWIAVSDGNSVTATRVRSHDVYVQQTGYCAWKPDGTAYRVHSHQGEVSQIFTFNLKTKTSSYKGVLGRNCCFYKDDYVLTNEGEMYKISDLSTKVRTLSGLSLTSGYSSRALNSNIMYCIDNFVLLHGLWDFFKIYYINPSTYAVTTRYSNSYSMSNSAELKRTVCWGSLESKTLSVVPMSATTINRVMKVTMEETLKSMSVEGEILMNTDSGDATAANILNGKIAFAANAKVVGTMPNRGTRVITPGDSNITIPNGYHSGSGYVKAVDITSLSDYKLCDAIADSILEGTAQYIPLEYIQSTGTQWINTNIKINSTDIISIDMGEMSVGGERSILDASGNSWLAGNYLLCSYENKIWWCCGSNVQIPISNTSRYTITVQGTGVKLDNTTIRAVGSYSGTVSTLRLMNTENKYGSYKLFGLKIYSSDNTLKHDLIPIKNYANSIGLYDKVSGEFYSNAGTGTFIAGPEIANLANDAVLNLTASRNNGSTFDTSLASWRDLSSGTTLAVSTGTWSDNALNCSTTEIDTKVSQSSLVDGYTIIARINSTEWVNYRGLFGLHYSTPAGIIGFQATNGTMQYSHYHNKIITTSFDKFPLNTWLNVVARYNSSNNNTQIYVNGELVNTMTSAVLKAQGNIILGKAGDITSSNYYFKGKISHFIIYDRTLTDTELGTVYDYIESTK